MINFIIGMMFGFVFGGLIIGLAMYKGNGGKHA